MLNIRSIRSNFREFLSKLVQRNTKPDVIVLTEVWIYTVEVPIYSIDGYVTYSNCQENNAAGGVIIYVRDDVDSHSVLTYSRNVEACMVAIRRGNTKLDIVGVYRSPNSSFSNLREFIDEDIDQVMASSRGNRDCIWLGDMNIDVASLEGAALDYVNKIATLGLEIQNTSPTRTTVRTATRIDHVLIRSSHLEDIQTQVLDSEGISDHDILMCSFSTVNEKEPQTNPRHITDWERFSDELGKLKQELYFRELDPNALVHMMMRDLEACRRTTTITTWNRKKDTPLKPWITKALLQSIRHRDRLWEDVKKNPRNPIVREHFRKYRNQLRAKLRKAEEDHLRQRIDIKGDPKNAWRTINQQLRGKRNIRRCPEYLSGKSPEKAEVNKANEIVAGAGKRVGERAGYADPHGNMPEYEVRERLTNFRSPTALETQEVIKELKNGKAPGADGFLPQTLKRNLDFFVPVLQHLATVIFDTGIYPEGLKSASTILIHKKGDINDLKNYRPISLLSVFSKVIEKLMTKQLVNHLESNRILSDKQYGFRRKRGTQDAVLALQQYVLESIEEEREPVVIMLDYSSAFDCVPHGRLIEKMKRMGIEGNAIEVLTSYLTGRTQRLRCGEQISDPTEITCGIPQGGSLSAAMFGLYINDVLHLDDSAATYLGYADDISIMFSFRKEIDWEWMEKNLTMIREWSRQNGLLLNAAKSQYIRFGLKRAQDRRPIVAHEAKCGDRRQCSCEHIENVSSAKYLGVMLDERLSWKNHSTALMDRLRASSVVISKLSKMVAQRTSITVYKALFEAHLRYCLLVYGASFQNVITPIEKMQNMMIRRIANVGHRSSAPELYERTGILPSKKLYLKCILRECLVRNPDHAAKIVEELSPTHQYGTRNADNIRASSNRLVRMDKFYLQRFAEMYRRYPDQLKNIIEQATTAKKKKLISDLVDTLPINEIEKFLF